MGYSGLFNSWSGHAQIDINPTSVATGSGAENWYYIADQDAMDELGVTPTYEDYQEIRFSLFDGEGDEVNCRVIREPLVGGGYRWWVQPYESLIAVEAWVHYGNTAEAESYFDKDYYFCELRPKDVSAWNSSISYTPCQEDSGLWATYYTGSQYSSGEDNEGGVYAGGAGTNSASLRGVDWEEDGITFDGHLTGTNLSFSCQFKIGANAYTWQGCICDTNEFGITNCNEIINDFSASSNMTLGPFSIFFTEDRDTTYDSDPGDCGVTNVNHNTTQVFLTLIAGSEVELDLDENTWYSLHCRLKDGVLKVWIDGGLVYNDSFAGSADWDILLEANGGGVSGQTPYINEGDCEPFQPCASNPCGSGSDSYALAQEIKGIDWDNFGSFDILTAPDSETPEDGGDDDDDADNPTSSDGDYYFLTAEEVEAPWGKHADPDSDLVSPERDVDYVSGTAGDIEGPHENFGDIEGDFLDERTGDGYDEEDV